MEDFQSNSESDAKEEVRASIRGKLIIGILMCVALPLLPISTFFLQYSLPVSAITTLFIALSGIGIVGFVIVTYYKIGSSMLFRGMDVLNQIAPPEPFVEGKLAVLNKDPVYIIIQWGSNALLFVAFFQSERSFDKKVQLPRAIWRWEYTHPVGDIKVARREDEFTIPVDKDTYYTGRGVLYFLLLEETKIVTVSKKYTPEQLNRIVNALAQEIATYGSGDQSFDTDFE
ncbi:MAG: hypothetical protein EAX87_10865 [Candidatus Thorarchaeota archaeon]|nr:hypothetical protein [Candidatus Thorarchaeota archaeon]